VQDQYISLVALRQYRTMTILQIISIIFLVVFPLFEAACYTHLYWKRNALLIRKRNKSAIYVASLAGWLAYFNLVISIFGGVPCGVFYVASLLVAPISVGPHIIRALTLLGTIKYSQLIVEDEISSRVQRRNSQLKLSDAGISLPAMVAATEKKIEANLVMEETRRIVKISKLALLVIPTLLLILALAFTSDASQLLATDFIQCKPEPTSFLFASPAFGIMSIILALVVTILVKQIDDELQIADEIRRNSRFLSCTYVVIIVVRLTGHYEWQPFLQTIQQMVLSFSMAIVPFLPRSTLNRISSWAKQQGRRVRINPATKSAVPGYAQSLPKGRNSMRNMTSTKQIKEQRDHEMTVSWDAGLCVLLSTENGINLFSQHCAREFSLENVRFWCAVSDYREKFDEEKCITMSKKVDDEKSAPLTQINDVKRDIITAAKDMYLLYIDHHSNAQVNLSSKQRVDIKKAIESGQEKRETFDAAQKEIFSVMSRDSYPRFLASKKNRLQLTTVAHVLCATASN